MTYEQTKIVMIVDPTLYLVHYRFEGKEDGERWIIASGVDETTAEAFAVKSLMDNCRKMGLNNEQVKILSVEELYAGKLNKW